ncbi:MAG: S8 family serine peptidase, partial [Nitrososphaera sp.]|nr:S8 family serine peptidase [Nitrososphaera sp.]
EYLGSQWGLKTGAGTRTNLAWDDTNNRGQQNVIIAVLDTGLRTTHQDFIFRSGWTPATLVINSFNVLDGSTNVSHTGTDPNRFHGTWVAGVSSARVDNNVSGIAGAAFQCRITPVKICTASTIVTSNAEAGINYIIGKTGEFPSRRYIILAGWTVDDTASFQSTVEDAYNNHNILIVAAAGDNNQDINSNPRYPASYSVTLPVGAHDSGANRFPTSSFGSNVVMAPGVSIRTTNGSGNAAVTDRDGSSLAAAFVAGEAATVWGRDRNVNGSFTRTNAQVKAIIIDSANLDPPVPNVQNLGRIRTDLAADF